ncbi:hypothetical protein Pcinc_010929 [Petrolisthes cinctipes]|uniref:Phospholipid-transporting ATPase n=1 Tax=Petrolisthes cinctipes TaxID=88211 RepID=A0AAE1G804_PETCI|nr:hypothetical protein Pcinc_010929 [Petrolisthes cinctipes]
MGSAGRRKSKSSFFRRKKVKDDNNRTVLLNRQQPEELQSPLVVTNYVNNKIKSSKYSIFTFIPKNLFEQFRRIANFYFLCVAIIQLSIESPISPMTSILPLVFVITVTAVKQGYEDWLRHREDNKVNNAPARVLREGKVMDIKTCNILVGDVVEVGVDEQFPCDLVLLLSSDPEDKCEVTTANLDGETNLKTFVCPAEMQHLTSVDDLWRTRAIIECQMPHANLYDFKGRLEVYRGDATPTQAPLSTDNLLLRGARLKNTSLIHGVAVYTGEETKMALNSKMTNSKFSTVEKSMNYFLVFYLVLLVVEMVVSSVIKYQFYDFEVMSKEMWYLGLPPNITATAEDVVQDTFSFLVIYNYIIPISLYVTLEVQKFLGAMFMEWDDQMKCQATGERCKCNTSDLNEELGQVQYLFTDKTGTLTENTMNFRQCTVGGSKYKEEEGQLTALHPDTNTTTPLTVWPVALEDMLVTLALCHTVQVSLDTNIKMETRQTEDGMIEMTERGLLYQAASPDEKALVEACARYGVVFEGQYKDQLTLTVHGNTRVYTRLQVIEFDSDRKCMSVVVREEVTGKVWLLTKGAESSVLQRCGDGDSDHQHLINITAAHIDDYAMLGLRTLAVARRELSNKTYNKFASELTQAKQMVDGREAAVREITDRMEADLTLLGATGVEDLLQEGVQETLEALRVAGIKVWVLTGDKVETAVNIAYSCGHFKRFMTILTLTGLKDEQKAHTRLDACLQESEVEGHYGLVVDGVSLQLLLDYHKDPFYSLCRRCTAVTCCRMSPRQKAETVRLVKTSKEGPVCAAIGDGANDVSMIQEAHIGLGVMGKEGRQAVRCSDFAFAQFRFLQRALLVHGHWYYVRVSTLVQYSFYKNLAFITPQIFFAIWNAFSTQSVYDSLALTMFNITYTSLPVLVFGLFDQSIPQHLLLQRPHLYRRIAKNVSMSWLAFFKWAFFGLWHTSVLYFGLMGACWDDTCGLPRGETPDLYLFGTTLVSICVFITNCKLVLESRYMTQLFMWSFVITAVGYVGLNLLYQGFLIDLVNNYGVYWTYYRMFESPSLLLTILVLTVVCLTPDVVEQVYRSRGDPRAVEKYRRKRRSPPAVTLKAVINYVNESFDPMEGGNSVWEVTKKATTTTDLKGHNNDDDATLRDTEPTRLTHNNNYRGTIGEGSSTNNDNENNNMHYRGRVEERSTSVESSGSSIII